MFKIFPGTFTHDGRKVPVKDFSWKEMSTDDLSITSLWPSQYPQLKFYGIPTGAINNILVLDVDVKDNGHETVKKYHIPLTMSQATISGGKHFVFKYPQDGKLYGNRVKFDQGLDVRGEGGYIAHYGLDNTPIAEAPEWLLEVALNTPKEIRLEDAVRVSPSIARHILDMACENIRQAAQGESNNVLNVESYKVGQILTSISYEEAYSELFKAAKDRGKQDYEAKATINSGLNGGAQSPLTSPFGNSAPILSIPETEAPLNERWTPNFFTRYDLTNISKLRKPEVFKDWSTEDIHITTADGGTGKTTLKLVEAISLALGESFLGFECKAPGRTLFITGEDTKEKLGAMIGAILKQMKILDDPEKVAIVLNSIVVKKDSDLCIIAKNKNNFITVSSEAIEKVSQAIEDIRPKMIVFDPISSFWGSEALLNDMSKAVAKFMGVLVEKSNACVEVINHMGKQSSNNKDMSQFAGRGGTGLPSHARVSRVLRPLFEEEFEELVGYPLPDNQSAMVCNVNKFSDGSPLYNKPFVILRDGYLFSRVTLVEQKIKEAQEKMTDTERIFTFIAQEREANRFPTKEIVISKFISESDKISKDRVNRAIANLIYSGHMGEKLKLIDNPDATIRDRALIICDMEGKEN